MTGHFYGWVGMFLDKCPLDSSCGNLGILVAPQLVNHKLIQYTHIKIFTSFQNYNHITRKILDCLFLPVSCAY